MPCIRIRPFLLFVLVGAVFAVPAAAQAATPPRQTEAVTVKRYLMGRIKPDLTARGAAHLWTNTGFSNRRAVYPVIAHKTMEDGSEWLQVRAIRDRSQTKVWIPKWATRRKMIPWLVRVDISSRRATIYRNGKTVHRWKVVVGARNTPTPRGHFYVVDRMHLHTSWAPNKWALATSAFSRVLKHFDGGVGQVALHARGFLRDPVGTAASHGCVRFKDSNMAWMASHIPNGTSIWIEK
jgi:lipoprotein-anchoring transpeptidase ErfK/SrfK